MSYIIFINVLNARLFILFQEPADSLEEKATVTKQLQRHFYQAKINLSNENTMGGEPFIWNQFGSNTIKANPVPIC